MSAHNEALKFNCSIYKMEMKRNFIFRFGNATLSSMK